MKDMDLTRPIKVGERCKAALVAQLAADVLFLNGQSIIDYSLLVGIHNCDENRSCCKRRVESMCEVLQETALPQDYLNLGMTGGGPLGTSERFKSVYFVGMIDMLEQYTITKRLERFLKTTFMCKDSKGLSVAGPDEYAHRFRERIPQHIE